MDFDLDSSVLSGGSYDEDMQSLVLYFNSGSSYTYFGVPKRVVDQLVTASSAGAFFVHNIKDVYSFRRGG